MSNGNQAVASQAAALTYPKVGEVFELTLDFDALGNQPLEMVRLDGYNPQGWNYTGKKLTGKQTRKFKLVQVGYCRTWDELLEKLKTHGEIPEGQWRQAFKKAYRPDGKGPVGVADSSWFSPSGVVSFPFVDALGGTAFGRADLGLSSSFVGDDWRWLVACK